MDLLFLVLYTLFALCSMMANLVAKKFVVIGIAGFNTTLSAGTLIYPFCYFFISIIAELYGKEKAKLCVKAALCGNIACAMLIIYVGNLDAASWSEVTNQDFIRFFGAFHMMIACSAIVSYISQRLDVFLYTALKAYLHDSFMMFRTIFCTLVCLVFDTVFLASALYIVGIVPYSKLYTIMFSTGSFKILFSICSGPILWIMVYCIRFFIKSPKNS